MVQKQEIIFKAKSVRNVTPTVFEIEFDADRPFIYDAGQFVNLIIPGAGEGGKDIKRAYSLSSSPQSKSYELCIKMVKGGPGSNYVYRLKPGEEFRGYGPYGKFVYVPRKKGQVVFISTGTGLAPFRSIIFSDKFKKKHPPKVLCIFGVRGDTELLYNDEIGSNSDVEWIPCVTYASDRWYGYRGRVTDYLRKLGDSFDWMHTDFYLCGNGAMIKEVKEILKSRGVDRKNLYKEKYF